MTENFQVQDILKKKQKELKSRGKGNKPNAAEPLTDEDISELYAKKVLGNHAPRPLLNTVWMNNCIFFGMQPGQEQRNLCWGDVVLKTDSSSARFLQYSTVPSDNHAQNTHRRKSKEST